MQLAREDPQLAHDINTMKGFRGIPSKTNSFNQASAHLRDKTKPQQVTLLPGWISPQQSLSTLVYKTTCFSSPTALGSREKSAEAVHGRRLFVYGCVYTRIRCSN